MDEIADYGDRVHKNARGTWPSAPGDDDGIENTA